MKGNWWRQKTGRDAACSEAVEEGIHRVAGRRRQPSVLGKMPGSQTLWMRKLQGHQGSLQWQVCLTGSETRENVPSMEPEECIRAVTAGQVCCSVTDVPSWGQPVLWQEVEEVNKGFT